MRQQKWFGSVQGFSFICFWRSIYGDLKTFPAPKGKYESVRSQLYQNIQRKDGHSLTPKFASLASCTVFTLNSPRPVSTHLKQRWYLYVEESRCVRAEGEEVWAERDVVSEDSMFIPPWGEGCHCWIPVHEVWRPIPVSQIIHSYRSDVSYVEVTLPQ